MIYSKSEWFYLRIWDSIPLCSNSTAIENSRTTLFPCYLDVVCPFLFWNPFIPGILRCSVFMMMGPGVDCVYQLCLASTRNIPMRISIHSFLHRVHVRVCVCVSFLELKFEYWILWTDCLLSFGGYFFLFCPSAVIWGVSLTLFSKHSISAFVFLFAGVF